MAITGTEEAVYEIPASWKWVALGETVKKHLGGGTPLKSNSAYWGGNIFWASVKDVGKGKYIDETIDRITEAGLANSSSNLVPPGNLIVVTRMGLGKVSINRVPVAINQDLRALFLSTFADIGYYFIFFKTHEFEGTGLTVKGIRVEELLNIPFPLPPLAEQYRIVAKVDELMTLCDQLEEVQIERERGRDRLVVASLHRLNQAASAGDAQAFREHASFYIQRLPPLTTRSEHIKELRQTILDLAVRGQLVPQEPCDEPAGALLQRIQAEQDRLLKTGTISRKQWATANDEKNLPFPHPQKWEAVSFGSVCNLITSGSRGWAKYYSKAGPLFIRAQNIRFGKLRLNDLAHVSLPKKVEGTRTQVSQGDLMIVITGAGVTNPALLDQDLGEAYVSQHVALIKPTDTRLTPWLLLCLMAPSGGRAELVERAYGAGKPGLNLNNIRSLSIPLAPLAEQDRIMSKVEELMTLCDRLEKLLTTTQSDSGRLLDAVLNEALNDSQTLANEMDSKAANLY